jgi:hypothetical protein
MNNAQRQNQAQRATTPFNLELENPYGTGLGDHARMFPFVSGLSKYVDTNAKPPGPTIEVAGASNDTYRS